MNHWDLKLNLYISSGLSMVCCEHPVSIFNLQNPKICCAQSPTPLHTRNSFLNPPSFSHPSRLHPEVSSTVKLDPFTPELETRNSPIIVGDHYELAETVALYQLGEDPGRLLVKAEYSAALLPMSGYEKPQDATVNGYDARRPSQPYSRLSGYHARRPSQEPMYLQYALSSAADLQLQQPSTAYDQQSDHMNYGASLIYQPRATFEATPTAYNDYEPRRTLQVSSYNPQRGTKGAPVYIYLDSSSDLLSPTPRIVTLMFATRPVPADLTRLEAREQDICYRYLISATAPAFSETGCSNLRIPLCLQVQEQSRLDADLIDIGGWLYEDSKQLEYRWSPQEVLRKRKVTDEPSGTPRSTKRVTPSDRQTTQSQEYGSYPYPSASLAYKPTLHNIDFNNMERRYTPYGRSQLQQSLQPETSTVGSQGLIGGVSTSQSLMRPPVAQPSSWNSSYGRIPQSNAAPSFQVSSVSSPTPANPTLVRSSRLAPQPSPGTTHAGSSSGGNFNPHTLYPNRALLEIRGDLNAMQENWTAEERAAKRRIVRVWREQDGTTLNAYFKPVKADEQPLPHETYECRISCIYWEERDEYYVTSVDTICLLGALVAAKFAVEEKNRIRRNLECYSPCTISKGKPESESFFKLVMGFTNPKPLNIDKDVKVFHWPVLEQALKKIISKYSADPSSTFGPLGNPQNSTFSGPLSEAAAPPTASHGMPSYSQASPLQQIPAPSFSHPYTVPTLGSPYIPSDPSSSPYAAHVSTPSLSSGYTTSTIGRRRSSDVPTDSPLASTGHYSRHPPTSTFFASPYAPQEPSEATATLGLPGRASIDLSADFNPDPSSSGDAQYRRHAGVNDETATLFKEE